MPPAAPPPLAGAAAAWRRAPPGRAQIAARGCAPSAPRHHPAPHRTAARLCRIEPPISWAMVDALYVVPRQDGSFTQIENGISVQGLAVSGTSLFDYDWPAGARLCFYIAAAGMRRGGGHSHKAPNFRIRGCKACTALLQAITARPTSTCDQAYWQRRRPHRRRRRRQRCRQQTRPVGGLSPSAGAAWPRPSPRRASPAAAREPRGARPARPVPRRRRGARLLTQHYRASHPRRLPPLQRHLLLRLQHDRHQHHQRHRPGQLLHAVRHEWRRGEHGQELAGLARALPALRRRPGVVRELRGAVHGATAGWAWAAGGGLGWQCRAGGCPPAGAGRRWPPC
jgi:hypothetical protein